MRRTMAFLILGAFTVILPACTTQPKPAVPAPTLNSVSVTPNSTSVSVSSSANFKAAGHYSDGSTKDVTSSAQWTSSNTAIASIASPGVVKGMAAGTVTISASSGAMSASATLTVNGSGSGTGGGGTGGGGTGGGGTGGTGPAANLSVITISPSNPSVPVNTVQQLTATGSYTDGSSADLTSLVTWTSSSTAVATVDATGMVTGVAVGSASITATLSSVSASVTVAVTAPSMSAISISPDGLTLPTGITQQFTVTAEYADGSSQDLTSGVAWTSSAPGVATIDTTGLATLLTGGTTTIAAAVGSLSDSIVLTVVGAHLNSISITPASATMAIATEQQFSATGAFDDGSTQLLPTVQWSSTAQNVVTVNSSGVATAVAAGTSSITASSGTVTGTASVTVTSATLVSLAIAPLNSTMPVGASKQFTATGTYSDGSNQDVTLLTLWKSSDPTVASVNATGLVTSALTGHTTIQASLGSVTQSTTLTVSPVDLVSIAISPANPTIAKRTSLKFTATATYSDGSTAVLPSVSWRSSRPSIANVRGSGIVHGKKVGSVTITASAFGVKGTTTLTIGTGTLVSIEITPTNSSVSAGATQQFTATGTFSDHTTQDVTLNAHWSSTVASVATIANAPSRAGLATTSAPGVTTIGANSGGNTATTPLIVN